MWVGNTWTICEHLQLIALAEKGWYWLKQSIQKLESQEWTFFKHYREKMLYKYLWDEKSALSSIVGMSKATTCLSRSWVGAAEVGAWCQKHTYRFFQANPNWAFCFKLSIHKPQIRSKSRLTKVTRSYFFNNITKHYILTFLLLRCNQRAYVAITVHLEHKGEAISMLLDIVEVAKSHQIQPCCCFCKNYGQLWNIWQGAYQSLYIYIYIYWLNSPDFGSYMQ